MEEKRVLIVEDEMIIALLIEKMVQNLGHVVVKKVSSGEEAISVARQHELDIILMDIRLDGEINGIEAMFQIRSQKDIPVIFISGNTDKLHQEKVDASDYVEFLTKPITFSELSRSFNLAS